MYNDHYCLLLPLQKETVPTRVTPNSSQQPLQATSDVWSVDFSVWTFPFSGVILLWFESEMPPNNRETTEILLQVVWVRDDEGS